VSEALQLDQAIQVHVIGLHEVPKLLIEWSSPWEEFVTSIRPALSRSTPRLAGEAPVGILPYRGMLASMAVEAFLLFVAIVLPVKLAQLRPYVAPTLASHDVIYYSGDELPRIQDLGGAQAGISGQTGGKEAFHRTQTIRIARGGSLAQRVVDAPDLKLPVSREAVANLLAIRPNPGPPPLEGARSSRAVLTLPSSVIAPAPKVIRDYTRNTLSLESVIPPAPNIARDRVPTAPTLTSAVIPPAPGIAREKALVAPALDTSIVAPAPNISRDQARSAPVFSGTVVPPAPGQISHEISRSRVQIADVTVVPPPASAPEQETARTPKLTLPSPSVIAPPPSADTSPDLRRLAGGNVPDSSGSVVPPPPQAASGSLMNNILGKIFGTTDVVPPPPTASGSPSGSARGVAGGAGTSLSTTVVPPPPAVAGTGAAGSRSATGVGPSLGGTNVVPPPPSVSSAGRGTNNAASRTGGPGGTLVAGNVVPPPPSIGGGTESAGSGRGVRGAGLGGPLDARSVLAPPTNGGSSGNSSVLVSDQPGSNIGRPSSGGPGSLSMSPSGTDKPGLGGSGGGSGISRGNAPGSGMAGEGTGAGRTGAGHGSDPNAHGGVSPTTGPGGAGSGTSGKPAISGVDVSGGSVTLPSFGPTNSAEPNLPGRSPAKKQQGPSIDIVATSRSGGGFNFYGKLAGDNHTTYVETAAGTVVLQYADPASAAHAYAGTLTPPEALRSDLPTNLPHARVVIACVLDASGNLKNLQVLEPGPADITAKVIAALHSWKFRPAMRGDQPVEVNGILGFGIDTNDRF
jgi:hypothetical protein